MTLAHVHILLNHFPTIGMIVAMGLFGLSLIWKSDDVKRVSLAILFGLDVMTIAVYISGNAAWQEISWPFRGYRKRRWQPIRMARCWPSR